MTNFIPLIRAASALPWVRWLQVNDRPVNQRLNDAQLGFLPIETPNDPVPLLNVVEFMRRQTAIEGPDIGCRVVTSNSVMELEKLGLVALSAATVRDSLSRVSTALPRHCTHEIITTSDVSGALCVSESWMCKLDPGSLHVVQQYVAAMIASICRLAVPDFDGFERMSIVAHPEYGLSHLKPWFGAGVQEAQTPTLTMLIPQMVADAKLLPTQAQQQDVPQIRADWTKLRNGGSLTDSVRVVIIAMLRDRTPTVENVAFSAGMSPRTFQRRLLDEGTKFSALLDQVRTDTAVHRLAVGTGGLTELARDLGYANASVLSRAVHRRTGKPPTAFRKSNE
jgi:AraC-like DNA-binding protein